jgi:hypothetical protein
MKIPVSLYPLVLRRRVSAVSKDEADSGASWFSRRCEASSGDARFCFAPFATASLSLGLLGADALLTMRVQDYSAARRERASPLSPPRSER